MKRLGLSALGFVAILGLIVGIQAYRRTFYPTWHATRDREAY